ncbi:MAG: methionine--tRNA ligase [Nitrososphaerota archaeon]
MNRIHTNGGRWSQLGKWIVCGAWPYINTIPHLGTLIGSELSADVFARYLRLRGEDVVFVSGSDEHGTPIEVEAAKLGVNPQELTDRYHATVSDIFKRFAISFDNYTRTHNETHIRFCQHLFQTLYDRGYIYSHVVDQLYCESCNRFLPDRFVVGVCPNCGYNRARGDQCEACGKVLDPLDLLEPRCSICGGEPVVRSSRHWFFDLPQFSERIRRWLAGNEAMPEKVKRFSLNWVAEGLRPRAVTRDNLWGIPAPFPGSAGKTIYVWFEAVLGYVTATIEWGERMGEPHLWEEYWRDRTTRSVYFIGKDNIPFHTIILPALLMGYDESLILPWSVSATEYLTFEGQKFSKSLGVGVWLDKALEFAEADYWRYYLVKMRPEQSDSNFSFTGFQSVVNSDLNDTVGNFIHRVLSFINNHFDGYVPAAGRLSEEDGRMAGLMAEVMDEVGRLMDELKLRQSLEAAVSLAREGNSYLNRREPWKLLKTDRAEAASVFYVAAQLVKCLAILLHPFTPTSSERILEMLGLRSTGLRWKMGGEEVVPGTRIGVVTPLFRKMSDEDIEGFRMRSVH